MQPYTYGDPVSSTELEHVLATFVPSARKRVKLRKTPDKFLAHVFGFLPLRLEHEVNRCRGLAYDAGEHGFSYSVQTGEP